MSRAPTLDERLNAALSNDAKPADIETLIYDAENAASADGARRDALQDKIKRLQERYKPQLRREKKALEERSRLLKKVEEVIGPRRWRSPIKAEGGHGGGVVVPQAIVEAELSRLEESHAAQERLRSRHSKQTRRAIKQLAAALGKAKIGLPEDLRLLLGLDETTHMLNGYAKAPAVRLPPAHTKSEAALSALRICKALGIPLFTTRGIKKTSKRTIEGEVVAIPTDEVSEASIYLRLAAILYGDKSADMYHPCRQQRAQEARRRVHPTTVC
jgi:hypothetical protein